MRPIIPYPYFWNSTEGVRRIEVTIADRRGFWEQRGYHTSADPWAEERYG